MGITISRHPKSVIAKNLVSLSAIFFNAFDLRRCEVAKDRASTNTASPSVDEIEKTVNEVALRMIYKLNDTTFRPVFARLMEWSTALPKADKTGRVLRLQSVYGFCHAFFSQLKSVVTSYASYLVDNAVAVLGSISVKKLEERELWRRVLRTLASSFEHDQDGFWQAPAHFNTVAPVLTEQLSHAVGTGTADLQQDLIAALVELGAAIDSQEQQRALNLGILKKLRSEDAAVRLIAVKTEQALTDRIATEWMPQLPEMLPYISELQEDDDEVVERETHRWIVKIEDVLGESLDAMLQ